MWKLKRHFSANDGGGLSAEKPKWTYRKDSKNFRSCRVTNLDQLCKTKRPERPQKTTEAHEWTIFMVQKRNFTKCRKVKNTFVCVSLPGSTTVPSIYVKHGGCMVTNGTGTQMFIDKTVTEVAVWVCPVNQKQTGSAHIQPNAAKLTGSRMDKDSHHTAK